MKPLEEVIEQCLTVGDISTKLRLSDDTVRRMFEGEAGLLKVGHETQRIAKGYRRRYFTLRIPLSVYLRVQDRLQQREKKPLRRASALKIIADSEVVKEFEAKS